MFLTKKLKLVNNISPPIHPQGCLVSHTFSITVLDEVTLSWKGHVTQASQSEKAAGLIGLERGDHRKISKTEKKAPWEH